MSLTHEEELQAEMHCPGTLNVYKQGMASLKATEQDILKKIDAFKIMFTNEKLRLEAVGKEKEELSVVSDKEGIHLPESAPVPSDPLADAKSKQLEDGSAKLKEDEKEAEKTAEEDKRLTEEQLKVQEREDFEKENKMSPEDADKVKKGKKK